MTAAPQEGPAGAAVRPTAGGEHSAPARVITIDGPSGSGKSTVARAAAQALGWRFVDTGATYRAATLAVLRAGVDLAAADAVTGVVRALVARDGIVLVTDPGCSGVRLDGEDVTSQVRGPDVTAAVSAVSAVPEVRRLVVQVQRVAIGEDGAVAEGRDVGSVVAPDAAVKVYLDADPDVRAARRAGDGDPGVRSSRKGQEAEDLLAVVRADLERRDRLDSTRATSPLQAAEDAVHLDASSLTVEEVTQVVLQLAAAAGIVR